MSQCLDILREAHSDEDGSFDINEIKADAIHVLQLVANNVVTDRGVSSFTEYDKMVLSDKMLDNVSKKWQLQSTRDDRTQRAHKVFVEDCVQVFVITNIIIDLTFMYSSSSHRVV